MGSLTSISGVCLSTSRYACYHTTVSARLSEGTVDTGSKLDRASLQAAGPASRVGSRMAMLEEGSSHLGGSNGTAGGHKRKRVKRQGSSPVSTTKMVDGGDSAQSSAYQELEQQLTPTASESVKLASVIRM